MHRSSHGPLHDNPPAPHTWLPSPVSSLSPDCGACDTPVTTLPSPLTSSCSSLPLLTPVNGSGGRCTSESDCVPAGGCHPAGYIKMVYNHVCTRISVPARSVAGEGRVYRRGLCSPEFDRTAVPERESGPGGIKPEMIAAPGSPVPGGASDILLFIASERSIVKHQQEEMAEAIPRFLLRPRDCGQ